MADGGSIEVVARDRASGSVLTLSADPLGDNVGTELHGVLRAQAQPSGPFLYIEAEISLDSEGGQVVYEYLDREVVLRDPAGKRLSTIGEYQPATAFEKRYSVVAGSVLDEGGGSADVFAITDPVESLAIFVGAGCLVLYGAQIWAVKQTMDQYKAAGLVPRLKIKTSFLKFVSCSFDVTIDPYDPRTGRSLPSKSIHIGKEKKAKKAKK
jgi:hypothetical protein